MAGTGGRNSGQHQALQDSMQRMDRIEREMRRLETKLEQDFTRIRLDFKLHAEQDTKMHAEVMEALRVYHFAGLGLRTIRWLAMVGAAIVAILAFIKGWSK